MKKKNIIAALVTAGTLTALMGTMVHADDRVVNIGTMNLINGDIIAQYEKLYEEELGVKVNIYTFDSGRDVNTADFLVEQDSIQEAASLETFEERITTEFIKAAIEE